MRFYYENNIDCLDIVAVGVTFDKKQEILQQLFQITISDKNIQIPVHFEKQQNNQFDKNAIKICVEDKCIGYVSKQYNVDFAKILDDIKNSYIKRIYMNNKRIFSAIIKIEF